MIFRPTAIAGLVELLPERHRDARGAFFRTWCAEELRRAGIDFAPSQMSLSENTHRHTLRGMHFRAAPKEEQKLVRCVRGAVFDAAIDLRPGSPTYLRHEAVTLSAEAGNAFFIPRGLAHGFLTLTEDAAVEYLIDLPYAPGHDRGVRWNDPAFGIAWPAPPAVIGERDATYPDHG
ncbi:dTDP-4-dehydrorhamnose 3,5-epimerase family protein [Falsiroseomonas sp. CW058]|uniref:dTDP-4-dehydrorhamnose 3,5-epimerase family protein n=1 Tax=Falsiroseomonas sp. CW058 TaxID=3388664 RepID=UPI003D30FEFD